MQKSTKTHTLRRLSIIEGQIRGLRKMIEDEKYCIDIIHQSLAIKRALSAVEDKVLEGHLSTHVIDQMKSGKSRQAIKEIMDIYTLTKKK